MWNDDTRPTGWLMHGLRAPDQATIEHAELACDEEFVRFLTARLGEEASAVALRERGAPGDVREPGRGLRVLHELVSGLEHGRLPDDVSLDLLTAAYAGHPDFQPHWRAPALLVPEPDAQTRSGS